MPENLPYAGMLFVSDMDGTLITPRFEMPARNIAAVRAFMAGGGLFAFATGRTRRSAGAFLDRVEVNAPCILDNGALVYDYGSEQTLLSASLPEEAAAPLVREVVRLFPEMGAEVVADQALYIVHESTATSRHTRNESLDYVICALAQVPRGGWRKLIFAGEPEGLSRLEEFVQSRPSDVYDYVISSTNFLEILPHGISKGSAVLLLADRLHVERQNIFAIGDYFNDLTLLREAALSGAPAGAPAEIRAAADIVVGPCEQGAVADFVAHIQKRAALA